MSLPVTSRPNDVTRGYDPRRSQLDSFTNHGPSLQAAHHHQAARCPPPHWPDDYWSAYSSSTLPVTSSRCYHHVTSSADVTDVVVKDDRLTTSVQTGMVAYAGQFISVSYY